MQRADIVATLQTAACCATDFDRHRLSNLHDVLPRLTIAYLHKPTLGLLAAINWIVVCFAAARDFVEHGRVRPAMLRMIAQVGANRPSDGAIGTLFQSSQEPAALDLLVPAMLGASERTLDLVAARRIKDKPLNPLALAAMLSSGIAADWIETMIGSDEDANEILRDEGVLVADPRDALGLIATLVLSCGNDGPTDHLPHELFQKLTTGFLVS
ncbi:hypothetical protein IEU95_08620 [Hoyosella rhizosphaerae]|nr:hypothetical protein [Hoyosella rhizosphaerae]MBN4926892.1 hypothetical protein [Hoyosella rhizosphaerae]